MTDYVGFATSQVEWIGQRALYARTESVPMPVEPLGTTERPGTGTGAAYEEVFYISREMPKGHWLHYAVPVRVYLEEGEFVATQPQLSLHAFGASAVDAIHSLREEMIDYYERLKEFGSRLSPRLAYHRDLLQHLLTPRDA